MTRSSQKKSRQRVASTASFDSGGHGIRTHNPIAGAPHFQCGRWPIRLPSRVRASLYRSGKLRGFKVARGARVFMRCRPYGAFIVSAIDDGCLKAPATRRRPFGAFNVAAVRP
jgi:hypothetical protein